MHKLCSSFVTDIIVPATKIKKNNTVLEVPFKLYIKKQNGRAKNPTNAVKSRV